MAHDDAAVSQRVRALENVLEQRGVVDGATLDRILDRLLAQSTPRSGARVVARAWLDDAFRRRLLADGNAAIGELGLSMSHGPAPQLLRVVQNTEDVHNVIVCTLCSCYPISLLGPSPSWYKSEAYRSRVVRWPREVLAEFGLELPAQTEIRVWDSSAETRYLVVPRRPAGTEYATEDELAGLVTRAGMIGTAAV
ncbi:MAG: nitrile hydratase subunit alpha [Streptosporangiales bacterium]